MTNAIISQLEINSPTINIASIEIEATAGVPQMFISFMEIAPSIVMIISGNSSNTLSELSAISRGNSTYNLSKMLVSFLEINAASQVTRVGISNKLIPRVVGTARGSNIPLIGAPVISSIYPPSGTTISSRRITITVGVHDNYSALQKVEIYIDGYIKKTDTIAPYSYVWDTRAYTNGDHIITIKAYNMAGKVAVATATIRVI